VGIATAKGLAVGLGVPALGVGRLELDAYPHRAFSGTVVAIHRAGRGELAWAAYGSDHWGELSPPRLSKPDELAVALNGPSLLVGEVDDVLLEAFASDRPSNAPAAASIRRAASLAELVSITMGNCQIRVWSPWHCALARGCNIPKCSG
jgi:tRNA A37 threonylcarbamoyladenosine modification protein TsaB